MTFSASTCLSYTGTTTLTGPISAYTSSGVFITAVTLNQITNCPLVLTGIPDGTTTIQLKSANNFCCDIPLTCNDLCTTCDLDFSLYQSTSVGRIEVGNLTGSCDNLISDYKISWYGPNSTTQLAFTSGFGNGSYEYTHPLTGTRAVIQPVGVYTPVINQVNLNGLNFSQTGGNGVIQAEMDCLSTIEIQAYNCSNGTIIGDYTHRVNFTGAAAGVAPQPLSTTFDLDPTTDYFAWAFSGDTIPDSLKITFSGSSYNAPLILDWWTLGSGNSVISDISILNITKTGRTANFGIGGKPGYFSKVTSLTSLQRAPGDYLILEVIPNVSNPITNWDFYFTCKNTFNCSLCLDSYLDTPYKIKTSSITNTPGICGQSSTSISLSGCSLNQIAQSDIWKYSMGATYAGVDNFANVLADNSTNLIGYGPLFTTGRTSCAGNQNFSLPLICAEPPNNNTITFIKDNSGPAGAGIITMTFSDLNDLLTYKNGYETRKASSGYNSDPTNINYYQYILLAIINRTGTQECGDGTTSNEFYIHYSSEITTGGTTGNFTLTMNMPTITKQINYTTCQQDCDNTAASIVSTINTSSTGTGNNINRTTNRGQKYTTPFYRDYKYSISTDPPRTEEVMQGYYNFYNSYNLTIPWSGNSPSYTRITSLSAQTCNFSIKGTTLNPGNPSTQFQQVFVYEYKIQLTNYPDLTSYTIKANPISNGVKQSSIFPDTVLTVVNGSIVGTPNPNYTF